MSVIANWMDALRTTNVREGARLDPVTRWLLITRASVVPMTFFSGAIGGLLAIPGGEFSIGLWALCTVGLVITHASNNMMNDYFDLHSGVDTPDYTRALYAPHPILGGLTSERGLLTGIAVANILGVIVAGILFWARGWPVLAFAAAGFALSFFYAAPPLSLKKHGLGEPSVFVVWGPLMIGGTYYVTTGTLPAWVWGATVPYGLLVMTVLFGKHIDKIESDRAKGIHTLPVILGESSARHVAQALMLIFYAAVCAQVFAGTLGVWALLVLGSVVRLGRILALFHRPPPESPPEDYPVWPLWYVAAAFILTRQAGALFALGLLVNAIYPLYL